MNAKFIERLMIEKKIMYNCDGNLKFRGDLYSLNRHWIEFDLVNVDL